jgi:hypothetical protein
MNTTGSSYSNPFFTCSQGLCDHNIRTIVVLFKLRIAEYQFSNSHYEPDIGYRNRECKV